MRGKKKQSARLDSNSLLNAIALQDHYARQLNLKKPKQTPVPGLSVPKLPPINKNLNTLYHKKVKTQNNIVENTRLRIL